MQWSIEDEWTSPSCTGISSYFGFTFSFPTNWVLAVTFLIFAGKNSYVVVSMINGTIPFVFSRGHLSIRIVK